ncbi:MAG: hypothetical protein GX575_01335 [Candidatus Anammoximicrobium sp.]|nr:hypothetical protein [Candidatus Anammoximicrobium sp.]
MLFQLQPERALNSLKSLTDIDLHRSAAGLKLPTAFEIRLGLIGASQLGIGEAAEVVAARILASLIDRFAEQLVGLIVTAGEVGMHTLAVQLL